MSFLKRVSLYISISIMYVAHVARHTYLRIFHRQKFAHGVRVILIHTGRVVLVRHWYAPGVWTLPGGGIQGTETAEDAGRREAFEETGLTVDSWGGEVGTYRGVLGSRDTVTVFFSEDVQGSMKLLPSFEIMERGFFDLTHLPGTISPANRRRIEAYQRGVRNERGTW